MAMNYANIVLLEKWGRACAYCGARDLPLQVEHIHPRSRGGSDRVSNLTLACQGCNTAKGNQDIRDFLAYEPARLERLLVQAQVPLRDAAAINTIRWAIGNRLKQAGLPVAFWSGGRTKFNRIKQGYPKDHWVDASCVGEQPALIPTGLKPLLIKAVGYGSRQMCLMDKYGFPRTSPKQSGRVKGFKTGDRVIAIVPTGKKAGKHLDRVGVRASGSFRVGKLDGISFRHCRLLHHSDGYEYKEDVPFLPGVLGFQAQVL